MEAHNRVISHFVPIGEQLPMEISVEATPITPFLEPETPAVPQKIPQPLPSFTSTVYLFGKRYDQTGEVHFVRSTDWI